MTYFKHCTVLAFALFIAGTTFSQGVAVNTDGSNADASALLDVKSTNAGLLVPRMTQAERNAIASPATSLLIFQTDNTAGYYYYDGSSWIRLTVGTDSFDDADADPNNEFQNISISGHDITLSNGGGTVTVPDANTTYTAGNQLSLSGTTFDVLEGSGSGLDADQLDGHEWSEIIGLNGWVDDGSNVRLETAADNVGIGTSTPAEKLHINGNIRGNQSGALRISTGNGYVDIGPKNTSWSHFYTDRGRYWFSTGVTVESGNIGSYDENLSLQTGGTTRATILNSNGNFGIGTTTPLLTLDVRGRSVIGNAFTPTTSNDDNVLNLEVGSNATGSANGISFHENTGGFGMKLGYDGTGSGATNKMAIYSDSNTELITFENGGEMGIGVTAPNNDLDVNGNAQISEYLLVGNPGTPSTTASGGNCTLYGWNGAMGFAGWNTEDVCGNANSTWQMIIADSYDDYLQFDNDGSYSVKRLYTPWIWVPSSATGVELEAQFMCDLENNYDGVYLEYTTNGTTWTKISTFSHDAYPDNASGSNNTCGSTNSQSCWNGSLGDQSGTSTNFTASGNWVRFRFVGMEDGSNSTGSFRLFGFALNCNMPSFGGSFANGNIYAQNNVYAGSNVLLGDLAEYFKIVGGSEAGDLITMSQMESSFAVTQKAYDKRIIGVHSTNPTLTLNDPRAGNPVALTGRVPVKVSVSNGQIQKGDYLTSSNIAGTAMKADKACYIVGKALEDADQDGKILCLIQPGYYNPLPAESFRKTGSIEITKGSESIIINDPSIGNDSRVFITITGNPGSYYWIQEKLDGQVTLAFEKSIPQNITCEYLIEGAINENVKALISLEEESEENFLYDEEKGTYYSPVNIPACRSCSSQSLPLYEGIQAPPIPEDTERMHLWSKENGTTALPMPYDNKERVYPENDGLNK